MLLISKNGEDEVLTPLCGYKKCIIKAQMIENSLAEANISAAGETCVDWVLISSPVTTRSLDAMDVGNVS